MSAYHKHQIIKTHPRNHNSGQWVTDEKDYSDRALYHLENTPIECLTFAKDIGKSAYQIVSKTLGTTGSRIGLRKVQVILRLAGVLDDNYPDLLLNVKI